MGLFSVFELIDQNFSGCVLGKLRKKFNFFGHSEPRHVLSAERGKRLCGELAAGSKHHACLDMLSPELVRNAVYADLGDIVGKKLYYIRHFLGIDVFAAGNDEAVFSSADKQIALSSR